jgi:hypothetical protein
VRAFEVSTLLQQSKTNSYHPATNWSHGSSLGFEFNFLEQLPSCDEHLWSSSGRTNDSVRPVCSWQALHPTLPAITRLMCTLKRMLAFSDLDTRL